ncbi:hypothetical protein [Caballeronia concitans]|uniref:hypothetical protein n=1 Tax=Caballeronia concitans TaxID=1777133 RepID=UPI00117F4521|nr:hypothetical protein [Caballeronia concitans]
MRRTTDASRLRERFPASFSRVSSSDNSESFGSDGECSVSRLQRRAADYKGLERRTRKVGVYLEHFKADSKLELTSPVAWAYATALKLLYREQFKQKWYDTATAFNLDRANRIFAQDPRGRALWLAMQADMEAQRAYWSSSEKAFDTALGQAYLLAQRLP